MRPTLIIIIALVEIASWRIVAGPGRANEWNLMITVFAAQGAIALLVWHIDWSTDATRFAAISIGLAGGAILYAGTRAFVGLAVRVPVFRSHVADRYERARRVPLPLGLALAVLIAVPGEELFWRGLVSGLVGNHSSEAVGAVVALIGYIGVKAASGSLPLAAAAVVGGTVWGGLTLFTGGILAALVCHGLWTALMLTFPPRAGADGPPREMMRA